jgi:CRP-like cAMP-binding protein
MPPSNSSYARKNRLISLLSQDDFAWLERRLERVSFSRLEVLYDQHRPISFIYFPITCVASVVQVMRDGQIIEAATVGNEGAIGLPAVVLDGGLSLGQVAAQVPGEALRVEVGAVQELVDRSAVFRRVLQRYLQFFLFQIMQSVACNQLHVAKQRYCRWLLMMQDRAPADEVPLTQEFMAEMLGVRRETVAQTASELQRDGAIRYHRGVITILDRRRLETAACECYDTIRTEYERLLVGERTHVRQG